MKKRWLSILLTAALTLSLIPPVTVSAAGTAGVPDDFLEPVTLPLMPAADGELYDEPVLPLPDLSDSGFIAEVEGGEPGMPISGLLAEVGEAPAGATEISTAEQLQGMTKGTYVLTEDINLSGVEWKAINLSTKGSNVVLDGQGHTIKGLTVNATAEDNYGLFGYVYGDVTVKNLRLDDVTLNLAVTEESSTSQYGVGALFGSVKGTVKLDNVAADVAIARTGAYICKIGGLVGMSSSTATVSDVAVQVSMPEADAALVGIAHYPSIGGIVGELNGACSFTRCYARVNLHTTNWSYNKAYGMGGMVGYIANGHKVTSFTNCKVEGTLVSEDHRTGGLVGGMAGGLTLTNCVVDADMTGREVGGYCAYLQNYNTNSSCVDCRYSGKLTLNTIRESYAGGFIGQGSAELTTCAADVTVDAVKATGKVCHIGGLMGSGGGIIRSCALNVRVSDFCGTELFLGGAVGNGASTVTDTLVTLDAVEVKSTTGAANIGGLLGGAHGTVLNAQNCGAEVFINFAVPGAAAGLYIGGLQGRGSGELVKCWADGKIYLNNPGAQGKDYWLGGLVGSGGTMSQCWGGVDIYCAYCPDSTSEYGRIGGLAGDGGNMFSCWSDAKIAADGKTLNDCVGGLCGGGDGGRTYRDCTFTGTIEGVKAVAIGGILGDSQKANFYNCYVEGDLEGGERTGGLLGWGSHALVFHDCRFEGSVTAWEYGGAGGLTAKAPDGALYGTATLRRCEVNADITAPGGNAFGMAGNANAYDCEFRGELSGANMGGIGQSGSFYDCTATVWLEADQRDAEYMNVGGISSGSAAVASNCRVTNRLFLTVNMDENEDSLQIRFGGIGGIVSKAEDCETYGVSLGCYGDDSSVDEDKEDDRFHVAVGGIAGEMYKGMDNCRVSGSAIAHVTLGSIYVGGLAGKDTSAVNGSSVTGCVASGGSGTTKKSTVYAGGLLGTGTDKTLISGCVTSGGFALCSDNENGAHSGKWTGNDKYDTGSKDLNIPARPNEDFTILTFEYPDPTEMTASTVTPLADVTITAGGKTLGKTNSAGMLTVKRDQVETLEIIVSGSKDGYFSDDSGVTLAGGGSTSLYLMKKTEGKIYLTSALYTRANSKKTMDLLTDPNTVTIMHTETEPQDIYFGVDWNGADEKGRVLQLSNETGETTLAVEANAEDINNLYIQEHFKPEEDIYLEAKASFDGVEVTEKLKLKIKVKAITLKLETQGGEADFGGEKGLYFLDGLGFQMDLGELTKFGYDLNCENGVLTAKFYGNGNESAARSLPLFNEDKVKVSVGGEIKVPYSDEGMGQWSGGLFAGINRDADIEGESGSITDSDKKDMTTREKVFEWIYNHIFPPAIPLEFKVSFGLGAAGKLGIQGDFDKAEYFGGLEGDGTVKAFIGLGKTFNEDYEVTGGGEGTMKLGAGLTYTPNTDVTFDPFLEGSLAAKFTAKAGEILDLGLELKLGGFKWTPDGTTWYVGSEPVWMASERAYLALGGGFDSGAPLPERWRSVYMRAAGQGVVYENIHADSRAVLTLEEDIPVLYFTADDGTAGSAGLVAEHTALWRSRYVDGVWSDPVCISGSENGYPAMPDADAGYVVWVESPETDGLDGLLTSTDIKIARDGELIATMDGGGYVYAPEITADSDGNILVVWLADPAVNGKNFIPSAQTMQYARYDAAADQWESGSATMTATPVRVELSSGNTNTIYAASENGDLYKISGTGFKTSEEYLTGLEKFDLGTAVAASISEAGVLTIWEGAAEAASLALGSVIFTQPVVCADSENTYVIWAQNDGVYYADSSDGWTNIKLVCEEETLASRLSAEIVDGRPLVSYYRSRNVNDAVVTDLVCAHAEDISGTDLMLSDLELDSRDLDELGVVRLLGKVTNRMKTTQSGYAYIITDETGVEVTSGTVALETALTLGKSDKFGVLVGHDVTARHSYTVEILPLTDEDANPADNTATVAAAAESTLAATSFRKTHEGVELEALVKNIGAAPEDNLTVEIYQADLSGSAVGSALLTQEVEGLLPGSYRQILLGNTRSDTYYKVVLTDGEQELDSGLLMWSDPEASGIWVQDVDVEQSGTSCVTVLARGLEEDVQLHLALYQDGKMVANAMQNVDAWDGSKEIELNVGELPVGEYTYAVYLLRQADMSPLIPKYSDGIAVE